MITVVGLDGSPLSNAAASAIRQATLVVGAKRHLAVAPVPAEAVTVTLGPLTPALDALAAHDGAAVVLASGDPGFFGISRALRERGLPTSTLPALSSVAQAFARAGLSWDDATVVSAHGRDLRPALNVCRAARKVAVLTGPGAGPAEIGAGLSGWPRRLVICEALGSADERVSEATPEAAAERDWDELSVVLVLAEEPAVTSPGWIWPPATVPAGWALPDDAFDSDHAVITKSEARALILARLAPGPGGLIWDVGAGAGSVAVECARFGAAVVAVERDRHRCGLLRGNASRYGADIRVVDGEAPDALAGLPEPDAVFVGGGGLDVLAAVAALRPPRVVAAFASVERSGQAGAVLTSAGYRADGAMVHVARLSALPDGSHRLAGTNPVFVHWGVRS